MEKISEIDVSDVNNLKIIQQFGDRALTLMLGNQRYRERLDRFLNNSQEILERLPDVTTLDLRLSNITARGGSSVGRKAQ
jgi:hypothetical protein